MFFFTCYIDTKTNFIIFVYIQLFHGQVQNKNKTLQTMFMQKFFGCFVNSLVPKNPSSSDYLIKKNS